MTGKADAILVRKAGNQITDHMVEQGRVSAGDIEGMSGLPADQAQVLSDALNNDGAVDARELAAMEKMDESGLLVKMARFIGDTPRVMRDAAGTLTAPSVKRVCGFFRHPAHWYEERQPINRECNVKPKTIVDALDFSDALYEINKLQLEGKSVFPLVKLLLGNNWSFSQESFRVLAYRIDLSRLTDAEKRLVARRLAELIRLHMAPELLPPTIDILARFGAIGVNTLRDLKDALKDSIRVYEERGKPHALLHTIMEKYATATGINPLEKIKK